MAIITDQEVVKELGLCPPTAQELEAVKTAVIKAQGAVRRFLRYDPELQTRVEYYPQRDYRGRQAPVEDLWDISGGRVVLASAGAGTELLIQHLPIRLVWSLWWDENGRSGAAAEAFAEETLRVLGEDFWPNWDAEDSEGARICRDGILRSQSAWPAAPGSIKIRYRAGYTYREFHGQDALVDATPIWETCIDEAARRAKRTIMQQKRDGIGFVAGNLSSERLGDYSYTLGADRSSQQTYGNEYDLLDTSRERLLPFVNWGWPLAS